MDNFVIKTLKELNILPNIIEEFKDQEVDKEAFLRLSESMVQEICSPIGYRAKFLKRINEYKLLTVQFEAEDTGPKLWLNEIMVTKSIAKREFQKHNYEIAAKYCEKVLNVSSNDLETRILLSKCQQNTLQPHLSYKNHLLAETQSPESLLVLENGANVFLDNGEFEKSLITYSNGAKKRTQPPIFTFGILKASQIINDSTKLLKTKYRKSCLGKTVLNLAKHNLLENVTKLNSILLENNKCNERNKSFYLGHLAQDRKYFDKILKSSGPKCPFYLSETKIQNYMRHVIKATDVAEDQLYKRKQLYIHKCEAHIMRGERLMTQINQSKIIKTMRRLQIAKYLTTIIHLVINNEIKGAKQKTELMINFMEKTHYNSIKILDVVYRSFGVAQYLLFQYIIGLDEKKNNQRILILLGATDNLSNSIPLQESIFGPYDSNPKITKNKLSARMKITKSVLEQLYLNFEMAKCYLLLGCDYFIDARKKAANCLKLAYEINSRTWIANTLILGASIEFQLDSKPKCYNMLNKAVEIALALQVPGVLLFLKQTIKMVSQIEAIDISPNIKTQTEIINCMPNITTKMDSMYMFRRLNTMPINRQMSLVPGVILKHNNAKYSPAQAAHKYLSIVPGSQTRRLGIPDCMLQKQIQLKVNVD